MANSKLLKEAIADAKAVKETALANAKLALEEAFTPRLQSMLSQKMRAEAEMEDDAEKVDEELESDGIGSKVDSGYPETPGATPTYGAMTDLSVGVAKSSGKPETAGTDYEKVADINEEEGMEDEKDKEIAELKARLAELEGDDSEEKREMYGMDSEEDDEMRMDGMGMDDMDDMDDMEEEDEDDMDLEAIIRELESQLDDEDEKEEGSMYEEEEEDKEPANESEEEDKESANEGEEEDDTIDLEEILREMEAGMKDDEKKVDEEEDKEELKADLNEAYKTIRTLQKTINEVNLLNAKLLFANKLFRAHNMTNEQKIKVIETLDRTKSVREVKLVFSTLAENFKYTTSSNKLTKRAISEGIASKAVKSTKPTQAKAVITESANLANRFKKLAGIIK